VREIGKNHLEQHRLTKAEPFLRRSLDIRRKKLEASHPDLAKTQISLAEYLIGQVRYGEAKALLQEARTTFIALYGPGHKMARLADAMLAEIERARARGAVM
jgi:hypothetical protein